MGLFYSNLEVINFAISQNNNIKISTNLTTNFLCSISKNLFFQMYQLAEYITFIVKSFTETLCDNSINQFKINNNSSTFVDFLIDDNKESSIAIDLNAKEIVKIEERLSKIDFVWLEWFIGFSEGDGALCCDKDNILSFVLTQKEKTILFHIQSILGFGNVNYDNLAKCWRYRVSSLPLIFVLAKLFNGKLVMVHRIKSWLLGLKYLNQKVLL